jgi:hypothetical protein
VNDKPERNHYRVESMTAWMDLEFISFGSDVAIISIGIVRDSDDGEYYAVNADMPEDAVRNNDWVMKNVVAQLPRRGAPMPDSWASNAKPSISLDLSSTLVKPLWVIRNEVRDFLDPGEDGKLRIVNWCHAWDHVAFSQMWGGIMSPSRPKYLPNWMWDIEQELDRLGLDEDDIPFGREGAGESKNHALGDARFYRRVEAWLVEQDRSGEVS